MISDVVLEVQQKMDITFDDVKYTVDIKKGKQEQTLEIIKGVSGMINSGRVTAVMGASGAGKTTFLNCLAGVAIGGTMYGDVLINGQPCDVQQLRLFAGFVHQDDVILSTMTVREALMLVAQLRLPNDMSEADKAARVSAAIETLHLTKCADTVIGTPGANMGVSGGERKRTSIGMEIMTNPSLLFLDEPTTGLDSFTALSVMNTLRVLARSGRTIVTTIHQPSSEVFHLFDDLILMDHGRICYHGPAQQAVAWFESMGYHCPEYTNPADFFFMNVFHDLSELELATPEECDALSSPRRRDSVARKDLATCWEASKFAAAMRVTVDSHSGTGLDFANALPRPSFLTQYRLLFRRGFYNMLRNKFILTGRLGQCVVLGVLTGLIYLTIGTDMPDALRNRIGCLFFIAINALFSSVMGIVNVFGAERTVFKREYNAKMYSLPAYFFSKTLVELPMNVILPIIQIAILYWMVGLQNSGEKFIIMALIVASLVNCGIGLGIMISSLFTDIHVALAVTPIFILPLMIFSGFFVNEDSIGPWFMWIQYLSPMKYGFEALMYNEFDGLVVDCPPQMPVCPQGLDLVWDLGVGDTSIGYNVGFIFILYGSFMLLAFLALVKHVRTQRLRVVPKTKTN